MITEKDIQKVESLHRPLAMHFDTGERDYCIHCKFERWPCITLRLATEVRRLAFPKMELKEG